MRRLRSCRDRVSPTDVARGLPTAVTLAAKDETLASNLVQALGSSTFRPYHTTDVRGVEIGGAAKNVLAIAAGIVEGRKLGASALAALTTRGFSELARLGRACGARAETLAGLSGLGDLILSCSSLQSRNFALGIALGRGEQPNRGKLAEGEFTAPVLIELAASQNVDMPVSNAVAAILSGKVTIDAAIEGSADAAVQGGGMTMAYWLVKSEPSVWSWDQQVAKGAKGEAWTGVRNFTARQNLVAMKKGDKRLLLSFQRGQGDRRHRGSHQGGLSRSDRQDRQIRLRRHQGGQAAEDAGDDGRDQGRQEARQTWRW